MMTMMTMAQTNEKQRSADNDDDDDQFSLPIPPPVWSTRVRVKKKDSRCLLRLGHPGVDTGRTALDQPTLWRPGEPGQSRRGALAIRPTRSGHAPVAETRSQDRGGRGAAAVRLELKAIAAFSSSPLFSKTPRRGPTCLKPSRLGRVSNE
jgi:hypothetical protein